MAKITTKKYNSIMAKLDKDPKSVSKNECLQLLSVAFEVPESTIRDRHKKLKSIK